MPPLQPPVAARHGRRTRIGARRAPDLRPALDPHVGTLLAAGAAAIALTVLTTTAAWAHASSELPHARLSAAGTTVTVVWTAAADDAADVAVAAGVWPEEVALAYLDVAFGGDLDLLPSAAEVATASDDPALQRYLEDRVRILQDEVPCIGTARPAADFVADGATIVFECPESVTRPWWRSACCTTATLRTGPSASTARSSTRSTPPSARASVGLHPRPAGIRRRADRRAPARRRCHRAGGRGRALPRVDGGPGRRRASRSSRSRART
jgi:hypothetical protein